MCFSIPYHTYLKFQVGILQMKYKIVDLAGDFTRSGKRPRRGGKTTVELLTSPFFEIKSRKPLSSCENGLCQLYPLFL